MKIDILALSLALVISAPRLATADVLGVGSIQFGLISYDQGHTDIFTEMAIGQISNSNCPGGLPCTDIFSRRINATDLGSSFAIDSVTNAEFGTIVALLTDGFDDSIALGADFDTDVPGVGIGQTEQGMFFPGGGGPDFAGRHISDLVLTLTQLSFQTPAPQPTPVPAGTGEEVLFTYQVK